MRKTVRSRNIGISATSEWVFLRTFCVLQPHHCCSLRFWPWTNSGLPNITVFPSMYKGSDLGTTVYDQLPYRASLGFDCIRFLSVGWFVAFFNVAQSCNWTVTYRGVWMNHTWVASPSLPSGKRKRSPQSYQFSYNRLINTCGINPNVKSLVYIIMILLRWHYFRMKFELLTHLFPKASSTVFPYLKGKFPHSSANLLPLLVHAPLTKY